MVEGVCDINMTTINMTIVKHGKRIVTHVTETGKQVTKRGAIVVRWMIYRIDPPFLWVNSRREGYIPMTSIS